MLMSSKPIQTPLVKFYRMLKDSQPPRRADRSAGGIIPSRAFRYCEPIRAASAFGWYIFPAQTIYLMWDGSDAYWQPENFDHWHILTSIQTPNSYDAFNSACPTSVTDHVPPMVSAGDEPGIINIWSGLFSRTKKDWSLLIRPPANQPRSNGYECYEGIIETDRWFGPLFINIRLIKTDVPIVIHKDKPLMQVQPLHRSSYKEDLFYDFEVIDGPSQLSENDWADYESSVIAPGLNQDRERGVYTRQSNKRMS